MYSAHSVAVFVINWCHHCSVPITNLKLQKLLYFIQGEYSKMYGSRLIRDDFYAWQLGPVVPCVYCEFAVYSSSVIPEIEERAAIDSEKDVLSINNTLRRYARISTWDLVEISHNQDPWKYNHQIFGDKALIPYESIEQYFREDYRS